MTDTALARLLTLLDVEKIEENVFRGISPPERIQRVYGGQVLAQALAAATRTVEAARPCHSFHAYFLRPGDPLSRRPKFSGVLTIRCVSDIFARNGRFYWGPQDLRP